MKIIIPYSETLFHCQVKSRNIFSFFCKKFLTSESQFGSIYKLVRNRASYAMKREIARENEVTFVEYVRCPAGQGM